jgi:nucleoid-associated protein YgaU
MSDPRFATSNRGKPPGALCRLLAAGLLTAALSGPALGQQDEEMADAEAAPQADEVEAANDEHAVNDEKAESERVEELLSQLAEREQALHEARRELETLRSRLPPEEGGTLDLESAQASARLTAQAMHSARVALRQAGDRDAAYEADIEQLGQELARDQALVARVQGGTLYRVRQGESLAGIAGRFYGDANRWPEIHEANAHILEEPDRIWPGMPLILP